MSKERRGEGGEGHMKLWQSLGRRDQPKTKHRQKTKTWVCLERETERSNERKRTNLKEQKCVWSGNPGGTSVTVTAWRRKKQGEKKKRHQTRMNPLLSPPHEAPPTSTPSNSKQSISSHLNEHLRGEGYCKGSIQH